MKTEPETAVEKPSRARSRTTPAGIAACVFVGAIGFLMCIHAVVSGMKQLDEDQREEILDLDERTNAELDADRLSHETEQLAAEREQLKRECVELEERLLALSAQAPKMPPIDTFVAVVNEKNVFLAAGSQDKVERGFQFSITRQKAFVARVVVQEVSERACACRVLIVKEGAKIEVGDSAATLP